ncbi:MAG: cysteine--tRNA ligase [Bacteroidota bacterium]|jgi:cysteinyl-tRNA synthetase
MSLFLYNTLSRKKEEFIAINPPFVGLYVCGPTVYSDVHLGNCRTFISFDLLYRYLLQKNYKVRYVRNITDAGHLEGDRDEGDDKFTKKAKLEQLEPMEIVQRYTLGFHEVMQLFNNLPPNIEPTATGHIVEQIEMVKVILKNNLAYEVNGTVYFDVEKYAKENNYGALTNRQLEDLISNSRELDGQDEKRGRLDFALWIKAKPEHLMKWNSPWGEGFPGWHIECSAMSSKYLGTTFDIHGGGMDLAATHHTNEIAQSNAYCGHQPANYWIHTNMLTVNGQRMGKSLGNAFLPHELFNGSHPLLEKGYSPMTVRFFMLQTHYRSTLDFSNDALKAAEKGFDRFMNAITTLEKINPSNTSTINAKVYATNCYAAMDDDLNTPIALAHLFDAVRQINSVYAGTETIDTSNLTELKKLFHTFAFDIFGLKKENEKSSESLEENLVSILLELRKEAKENKNYAASDAIRDKLKNIGIEIKDSKESTTWEKI